MTLEKANTEIKEWKRLASRFNIDARSVVFPRNQAAFHEVFADAGFRYFRDDDRLPLIIRNRYFGRYAQIIDHILGVSTAPSYDLTVKEVGGLIQLDPSAHLFAFDHHVDHLLDQMGLNLLRIRRILRGIGHAAKRHQIFHLWGHPWAFGSEGDFIRLERIFQEVQSNVTQGNMQSITMAQMGDILTHR